MISIIVPIYNAARYLPACLESMIHQTEQALQIILVEDESTDDSLSIARSYAAKDPRIEVYQQTHAGQSAARNLGMQHAKGEFIAFVDADDTIEADWCERHLEAIEGVDYVQSQCPKNKYQFTAVWGRLYRRKAITDLPFPEGMIYEDIIWSVALWLSGASCRMIDYAGYHYTINPTGTTSSPHYKERKQLYKTLRTLARSASFKGKCIIFYTFLRLKIYFIVSDSRYSDR